METVINAKTLRQQLPGIIERVRKGERFTVLYRSEPVCRIVPANVDPREPADLDSDTLYRANAVGRSTDGLSAADHDVVLYRKRRS